MVPQTVKMVCRQAQAVCQKILEKKSQTSGTSVTKNGTSQEFRPVVEKFFEDFFLLWKKLSHVFFQLRYYDIASKLISKVYLKLFELSPLGLTFFDIIFI